MKLCCIIGFLLSGKAVVPLAPSGPLSSKLAFSIADVMIWIRNVQGLWEIAVLCRLSSCSDGMLNTQTNIKTQRVGTRRDISSFPYLACGRQMDQLLFAAVCRLLRARKFPRQNSHNDNLVQVI